MFSLCTLWPLWWIFFFSPQRTPRTRRFFLCAFFVHLCDLCGEFSFFHHKGHQGHEDFFFVLSLCTLWPLWLVFFFSPQRTPRTRRFFLCVFFVHSVTFVVNFLFFTTKDTKDTKIFSLCFLCALCAFAVILFHREDAKVAEIISLLYPLIYQICCPYKCLCQLRFSFQPTFFSLTALSAFFVRNSATNMFVVNDRLL